MMRVDLHTHSVASPDGALRLEHYRRMLEGGALGMVAITDHDAIGFALAAQEALGARIIVGQEVTAVEGEVIGLYLRELVPAGLSAREAAQQIHAQGGLVYVPHPFETVRHGLPASVLEELVGEIDIIEVCNGRAVFQDRGPEARRWAAEHKVAMAASSDAHGWYGWGRTYSELSETPTRETLVELVRAARLGDGKVGWRGALYPKVNRLRRVGRGASHA